MLSDGSTQQTPEVGPELDLLLLFSAKIPLSAGLHACVQSDPGVKHSGKLRRRGRRATSSKEVKPLALINKARGGGRDGEGSGAGVPSLRVCAEAAFRAFRGRQKIDVCGQKCLLG